MDTARLSTPGALISPAWNRVLPKHGEAVRPLSGQDRRTLPGPALGRSGSGDLLHLDIIHEGHHDVRVRTTLTLERDVAERVRAEVRRTGKGMKSVVNEALRLGLGLIP